MSDLKDIKTLTADVMYDVYKEIPYMPKNVIDGETTLGPNPNRHIIMLDAYAKTASNITKKSRAEVIKDFIQELVTEEFEGKRGGDKLTKEQANTALNHYPVALRAVQYFREEHKKTQEIPCRRQVTEIAAGLGEPPETVKRVLDMVGVAEFVGHLIGTHGTSTFKMPPGSTGNYTTPILGRLGLGKYEPAVNPACSINNPDVCEYMIGVRSEVIKALYPELAVKAARAVKEPELGR